MTLKDNIIMWDNKQPKIFENRFKIGQRVALKDLNTPQRYSQAWIVGMELDRISNELVYDIAEQWDSIHGFKWISDGVREEDIEDESWINS